MSWFKSVFTDPLKAVRDVAKAPKQIVQNVKSNPLNILTLPTAGTAAVSKGGNITKAVGNAVVKPAANIATDIVKHPAQILSLQFGATRQAQRNPGTFAAVAGVGALNNPALIGAAGATATPPATTPAAPSPAPPPPVESGLVTTAGTAGAAKTVSTLGNVTSIASDALGAGTAWQQFRGGAGALAPPMDAAPAASGVSPLLIVTIGGALLLVLLKG